MATTDRTTKLDDDLTVSAIGFDAGALTSVYGDVDDAAARDSLRDAPPSNRYLLVYDYVEDIAERWLPYREAHAKRILSERDADWIETWVQADPFVKAGLVTRHRVNQWMAR